MGWNIDDSDENVNFSTKLEDLKMYYNIMKENYEQLKSDFENMNNNLKQKEQKEEKTLKKLNTEVSKLKEDYKECLRCLQKETFERNKAETTAKILKDTIEAHNEMKNSFSQEDLAENMEVVDQEDEETKVGAKRSNPGIKCSNCEKVFDDPIELESHRKAHIQNKISKKSNCDQCETNFLNEDILKQHQETAHIIKFSCKECSLTVGSEKELREHTDEHSNKNINGCQHCRKSFKSVEELTQHQKIHSESTSFDCNQCDNCFSTEVLMKEHEQLVHELQFNCQKCDKVYPNMKKLRRHDWRSHRQVSCNICEEIIESRQQITSHREKEHNMFRKAWCKFYPDCLDEDECFFIHSEQGKDNINSNNSNIFCPMGESCSDQSCSFSESNHRQRNNISCRFQENCKRRECGFRHLVERRAFLDGTSLNSRML